MKAGRELDALVAEKVIGLTEYPHEWANDDCVRCDVSRDGTSGIIRRGPKTCPEPPCYSTDIAAAWEVLMAFIKAGCAGSVWGDGHTGYGALVTSEKGRFEVDCIESAPLAICLAALKAVGVEVVE